MAGKTLAPTEKLFDIGELEFHVGRPPVAALAGMGRCFHFAQQRVHLVAVQAPPGAHRDMVGVAQRIVDQIGQNLLEGMRIGPRRRKERWTDRFDENIVSRVAPKSTRVVSFPREKLVSPSSPEGVRYVTGRCL